MGQGPKYMERKRGSLHLDSPHRALVLVHKQLSSPANTVSLSLDPNPGPRPAAPTTPLCHQGPEAQGSRPCRKTALLPLLQICLLCLQGLLAGHLLFRQYILSPSSPPTLPSLQLSAASKPQAPAPGLLSFPPTFTPSN